MLSTENTTEANRAIYFKVCLDFIEMPKYNLKQKREVLLGFL